jgi:hypothetical protein
MGGYTMYETPNEFESILNITTISSDKDNSYSLRNEEYICICMILYNVWFL